MIHKLSFWYRWKQADIGAETNEAGRPLQYTICLIQDLFGLNVLSFGFLGNLIESFFVKIPHSNLTHLIYSILAMIFIHWIRKLVAIKTGHFFKQNQDNQDSK